MTNCNKLSLYQFDLKSLNLSLSTVELNDAIYVNENTF